MALYSDHGSNESLVVVGSFSLGTIIFQGGLKSGSFSWGTIMGKTPIRLGLS